MTTANDRGAARESEQIEDAEDAGAELIAEGLGAFYRAKGARRLLRDGTSASLGSLLFTWADVGVQLMRRMVTLGAELGDGAFGRAFGGASGPVDEVAVDKPVRAVLRGAMARGGFTLENRRSGRVDVRFPRVAELHAAKGHDRQLVELCFDPEAPIVGVDEQARVEVSFAVGELLPGERYIGWVTIETTRGGRCSLAIEYDPLRATAEPKQAGG